MSTVFSFRAECRNDVGVFLRSLMASGISVSNADIHASSDGTITFPDVFVEIATSEASVEQLIHASRQVEDLHVIEQTLRPVPLANNSLERDCSIAA